MRDSFCRHMLAGTAPVFWPSFARSLVLDSISTGTSVSCRSLNTIFIAGSTDDFVDCLLPTYTSYRSSGLLWFVFLVIVHVLLLNLVLDTLVAAYTKYSEEQEEEITSEKVQGILNVFRTVSRVTDSSVITRQTFMDFCEEGC